jgi:hypothetical protein
VSGGGECRMASGVCVCVCVCVFRVCAHALSHARQTHHTNYHIARPAADALKHPNHSRPVVAAGTVPALQRRTWAKASACCSHVVDAHSLVAHKLVDIISVRDCHHRSRTTRRRRGCSTLTVVTRRVIAGLGCLVPVRTISLVSARGSCCVGSRREQHRRVR